MDLRGYVRAIRKSWWLIVTATVVGAGIAALMAARATPIYAAKLTFYVSTPLLSDTNSLQSTDQFAQDRANSYADLLSSDRLAQMVVQTAKLDMSPGKLASEVSGVAKLNTVMVVATINDASQARALKIAQAIAQDMPKLVSQLDGAPSSSSSRSSSSIPPVSLNVVSGPSVSSAPVSPRKTLGIAFGLGIGLVLGLAIAVLRELFDTGVRSPSDLAELTDRPVLGDIGLDREARKTPLIVDEANPSRRSEDYRQLRTNLQFLDAAEPLRVIVVTSSVEGEGKSTTAANLGVVFSEADARVVLVEADLRRPQLSSYLGLERASGLTTVLTGQAELADVLQPWGSKGLKVLASGPLPPNPSELLGSKRMADLIEALERDYDMIIFDVPPLLPVTDAAVLSTHGAGVLIVVRHGRTKQTAVQAAVNSLETLNARVLGTVLNMRPTKGVDASFYGDYYAATRASETPEAAELPSADESATPAPARSQAQPARPSTTKTRSRSRWPQPRARHGGGASAAGSEGEGVARDGVLREALEPAKDRTDGS